MSASSTANHHINQCEHGTIVAQCRCMSSSKTVVIVPCPPRCRADKPSSSEYVGRHRVPELS